MIKCTKCGMTFTDIKPAYGRDNSKTKCAEPGCEVSFYHMGGKRTETIRHPAKVWVDKGAEFSNTVEI